MLYESVRSEHEAKRSGVEKAQNGTPLVLHA